jgi:hypothetical protein
MSDLILPFQKPTMTENTEYVKDDTQLAMDTNHYLKRSGEAAMPHDHFYVGSAAFHIYKHKNMQDSFAFICATPIGAASEGMCDVGWKRLRSALMRSFGRAEPRSTIKK